MKVGKYDFSKSNKLKEVCKFTICSMNSKYNSNDKTWTVELPQFFTENEADYRQIKITSFIYYTPNGCSDVGTTFHSEDLFDGEYNQPELDYFVGVSGNSINGLYTIQSRRRTLTYWFKDYRDLDYRYGATEFYKDPETGDTVEGEVRFYIQAELLY